jgi:hypothetical protein
MERVRRQKPSEKMHDEAKALLMEVLEDDLLASAVKSVYYDKAKKAVPEGSRARAEHLLELIRELVKNKSEMKKTLDKMKKKIAERQAMITEKRASRPQRSQRPQRPVRNEEYAGDDFAASGRLWRKVGSRKASVKTSGIRKKASMKRKVSLKTGRKASLKTGGIRKKVSRK